MGKAVPKGIKSKVLILLKEYPESFKSDFEHNKKVIMELGIPLSKTDRNLVIGFISRKIKQQELKEKAKAAARKAEQKIEEKAEKKAEEKIEQKPEPKKE